MGDKGYYCRVIIGDGLFRGRVLPEITGVTMTTEEVIARFNVSTATACQWAAKNGVGRVIKSGIAAYDWTEADCARFAERRGRGWTKGRPRKQA